MRTNNYKNELFGSNFLKQIKSLPCVRSTRRQPTKHTRSENLEAIFMRNTELSKDNHLLRTAQKHTPPTHGNILITDHRSIHETCEHRIDFQPNWRKYLSHRKEYFCKFIVRYLNGKCVCNTRNKRATVSPDRCGWRDSHALTEVLNVSARQQPRWFRVWPREALT